MRYILIISVLVVFLTGCATSPITTLGSVETKVIDDPPVGVTVTRGLGERLVAKGITSSGAALEVLYATQFNKKEGEASIMTCALTVMPGTFFKRGIYQKNEVRADCYGPVNIQKSNADGSTGFNCPGNFFIGDICRPNSGGFFLAVAGGKFDLEQDFANLRVVNKTITNETNFIQELIYNGRVGDNLKFIYREFSDDTARPAFTQEVQYDFAASKSIGFKSLRMEITSATNTEITYKLMQNF